MTPRLLFAALVAAGPGLADAQALGGQWYVGAGGGASLLEPDDELGLSVTEDAGTAGTVFLGRDLDDRSSVQLQLYALGEAELEDGSDVEYTAADAAVLYRFLDTHDAILAPRFPNLAVYGRFGLGAMERDSDVPLDDDSPVWFGAGAGLELGLGRLVALRLEGLYHDTDASSAFLSVMSRFGGGRPSPDALRVPEAAPAPTPDPTPDPAPDPAAAPASGTAALGDDSPGAARAPAAPGTPDADGDGVADAEDVCPASASGFPVRDDGCALLDGVLAGVRFVEGGSELLPGATEQLDYLARVLDEYPYARAELHAHTDDFDTAREQAILTRARLRTVGTYLVVLRTDNVALEAPHYLCGGPLVGRGVSANRLVLRSFGGTRPMSSNDSVEGRHEDNRFEVLENTARTR